MSRSIARRQSGDPLGAIADGDLALDLYALPHLANHHDLDPERARVLVERGNARQELADPLGAIADYDAALEFYSGKYLKNRRELDVDRATALGNRSMAWRQVGNSTKAIEDCNAALCLLDVLPLQDHREFDACRARTLFHRSAARQQLGDTAGAIADITIALDLYKLSHFNDRSETAPDRAKALFSRGNLRHELGEFAGAIEDYTAALDLYAMRHLHARRDIDLERALALTSRGSSRIEGGDLEGAIEDCSAALHLYEAPHLKDCRDLVHNRAMTLKMRGTVWQKLNDCAAAISDYEAALDRLADPRVKGLERVELVRAETLMYRGIARHENGDLVGAVTDSSATLDVAGSPLLKDRRELDAIRVTTLMNRSTVRIKLGDPAGAAGDCDVALDLLRFLTVSHYHERDSAMAEILMTRGVARQDLNDFHGALADFCSALDLHALPHLQHRSELDVKRAKLLMNRGNTRREVGDLAGAIADYSGALNLYALPHLAHRREFDSERAGTLMNRGNARLDLGHRTAAWTDYSAASDFYALPHLKDRPDLDADRAATLTNMINAWRDVGDAREAVAGYDAALRILAVPHLINRPELDLDRAGILVNRGIARVRLGDSVGAIADYDEALDLHARAHMESRRELDPERVRILMNRGVARHSFGDPKKALEDFDAALDLCALPHLEGHRELDLMRAQTRMNRGNALREVGDLSGAVADYHSAEQWQSSPSGIGGWRHVDPERIRLWANMAGVLAHIEDPQAWACERSERMIAMLELVPSGAGQARIAFARFHACWLAFCLDTGALEQVPVILSALQGRELAARLLDELATSEDSGRLSAAVQAYQQVRIELRKLAARIEQAVETDVVAQHASHRTTDGQSLAELDAEYRRLHATLPALREAAAQEPGYAALLPPTLDTGTLVERSLGSDEALVLLLDVQQGSVIDVEGALVLRRGRRPRWCPLPGMRQVALMMDSASDTLAGGGRSYRDSGIRADRNTEAVPPEVNTAFWPEMETATATRLWAPLAEALADVERAVCVTQGHLHLLPLDLGTPDDLKLTHYPGLVFYGYGRGLLGSGRESMPAAATDPIALAGYPGADDSLPFVRGEIEALALLHGAERVRVGDPYAAPDNTNYALLHLACHGVPSGSGAAERVALDFGPDRRVDMVHIMENPLKVRQVLIAACLGGRVRDGLDGEPSGVVGGYLYGGTRQVAAAVMALPDNWTMLMSLLIHQAWLGCGDLDAAITEAKRRLAAGVWFNDTEALLVAAAAPALATWEQRQLQAALNSALIALDAARWDDLMRPLTALKPDNPYGSMLALQKANGAHFGDRIPALATEAAAILSNLRPDGLHYGIAEILNYRIPPQPILGILTHSIRTFGELTWRS